MTTEHKTELKEGDPAPLFSAPANGGGQVSLADFKCKHVILYFYPRDNTPGCTLEACAFRDEFAAFKRAGAIVLGVSTDSPKAHDKFVAKYQLPFLLVSDENKQIVQAYGVWGEKQLFGNNYMGIIRTTFLIDENGKIKKIINKPDSKNHTEEILDAWSAIG